jgi:tetratricopeptide (TPR) repeat protein
MKIIKIENTLTFIFIILFTNNIFAYNSDNLCEKMIMKGENLAAIEAGSKIKNEYDKNFCLGKAYYQENMYEKAIKAFERSEKFADLPADQMFSILYKGTVERDLGEISTSTKTFTRGLETAKLGNSKYLEMEHRFLFQLGQSTLADKEYDDSVDFFSKSIVTSFNDKDRADGYKGLSNAYYGKKKIDRAIEYALKASNMYLKIVDLGEYADLRINLSSLHLEDGAPDRSLKILSKLEKFAVDNGSQYYEAKVLLEQSLVFKSIGEDSRANDKRLKGISIAKTIGAKDLLLIK